ncbi:MAG TPA: translation elongation factor-like protein [Candidatus Paceibacterota bacterium]|nr:translation elongation factor-like protein [Candidatus Paceibacterota bacterium]
MKKKKSARSNKKAAKKKAASKRRSAAKRKAAPVKKVKPIGRVTHYYTHIKVAIVKFNTNVKAGTSLYFKGATTDFTEAAKSMQFDHVPVAVAKKGKQIGIKLKKRVREGDGVYKA